MSDIYMGRNSIKCVYCGGNEFNVSVNYCIPRAVSLECKCGYITPIAYFDRFDSCYGVNGSATRRMYDLSFCEDLESWNCRQAVVDDAREYRANDPME